MADPVFANASLGHFIIVPNEDEEEGVKSSSNEEEGVKNSSNEVLRTVAMKKKVLRAAMKLKLMKWYNKTNEIARFRRKESPLLQSPTNEMSSLSSEYVCNQDQLM
ncbi:unnamed protein product [Citrullus colocynthis]|uniref:Uncharacterized protein n=1 Tax=Citrullus colocynthis TaxID=252529 RepID=A0ABP0XQ40_9ROSI